MTRNRFLFALDFDSSANNNSCKIGSEKTIEDQPWYTEPNFLLIVAASTLAMIILVAVNIYAHW